MSSKKYLAYLSFVASSFLCSASPIIREALDNPIYIHQFQKGSWCENLAPTPDGKVLVTRFDAPELYLIDPSSPSLDNAQLVANLSDATALLGITPISPNVYAFGVSNASDPETSKASNTYSIWRADLTTATPQISKVADVPALLGNGVTTLPGVADVILIADSYGGTVWHLNLATGASSVAINNTAFISPSTDELPFGVNGILVDGDYLYYTNSGRGIFGRVPIDSTTGAAVGPFCVLTSNITYDDFALRDGVAYLASGVLNEIIRVDLAQNDTVTVFAGAPNSLMVPGATSLRFGTAPQTKDTLYVSTNGGQEAPINGSLVVGGGLLAFEL
ncbi:MAG: hypothetical protein M1822_007264 [Bathelium mastoideum]|nr:MAG: hypothetical protein M1822_007264 [Bathelium mastoideum]